ncbi:MAG TPA: aliphatic sulfonate ABC transporter substrate-binding protein [Pseudorhodoplanes sp.]|nr:aliphatic sulfonate ABC transporter substrate-binding protein [Pseudorhodoplanes sp.]HWV51602.1 aliphatic sulfonate ABC transporter substrate-binding protein [Pseudorhodoplanes sp.]
MALAGLIIAASAAPSFAQDVSDTVRIGLQRSSTLTAILRANGELEKALAPLKVKVSWHEFTSGLPLLEALNLGNIDVSADVADTVPVFAQAAGAKLVYFAEEAASPGAQAILIPGNSPIKSVGELKGKKVAVTKGAGSHFLLVAALKDAGVTFKEIAPAYLTAADGRAAFVSNNVDAWVAWDPFLTIAQRQSGAKVLRDGKGLSGYKRYYLASGNFAARRGDVLKVFYQKLDETGRWVNAEPKAAAKLLSSLWGIDADIVEQALRNRTHKIGTVTKAGLTEQQSIADAFVTEGVLPKRIDTTDVKIWSPGS